MVEFFPLIGIAYMLILPILTIVYLVILVRFFFFSITSITRWTRIFGGIAVSAFVFSLIAKMLINRYDSNAQSWASDEHAWLFVILLQAATFYGVVGLLVNRAAIRVKDKIKQRNTGSK